MESNKLCKYCGAEIIKKSNESLRYFGTKSYCCKKCADEGLKKPKTLEQVEREKYKLFREGYCTTAYTHPLYDAWRNMKRRCYGNYKNSKTYKNYGGRGIEVCEEWKSDFNVFLKWALDSSWKKGLTIDRINNNGNYEPSNCRWITQKEQLSNRRNSRYITYKGETKSYQEWAKTLGLSCSAFRKRVLNWDDIKKIINEPKDESSVRHK